jgi:hypothetical protein
VFNEYYLYGFNSRSNITALKKSHLPFLLILMVALTVFTSNSIHGQEQVENPEMESRFELSPEAELSVITCGPGPEELYASFGHSAFRIQDIPNKIDRVYNYGTFDFDTPNFYMKFASGKLLYMLSAYDFGRFLQSYHRENRWVKGQVLDLEPEDVQKVFDYLENNALPENRFYKYDFFYDNCSTKLYDVLETVLGDRIIFENEFETQELSQRELISLYSYNQPWGDFGIDLALGANIDRKATAREYMFLPDYVFKAFECIEIAEDSEENVMVSETEDLSNGESLSEEENLGSKVSKPIVKRTEEILLSYKKDEEGDSVSPMQVGGIFLLLVLLVTFFDHRKGRRSRIFDGTLFIATGLAGVVMLLLWFATDHTATVNNFNVLWAFAPNLLIAFVLQRKPRISYWYMFTLLILLDILVALWIFQIQVFHMAMIPILGGLYVRYLFLWGYFRKLKNLGVEIAETEGSQKGTSRESAE